MPLVEIKSPQDLARLRRLALASQGLLQTQPFGRSLIGATKAIQHLGYVQLDTISVLERAHHHTLYSRVPEFAPVMVNQLLRDRDIFEYWSHAAALMPIGDFRFSLPYKHAIKSGQTHWFKSPDKKLMDALLARIRIDGPLRSRDLETITQKRGGWWDWKPAKKALEQLYMQGDLMVSDREGFQKTYDISERVLPSDIDTCMPSINEFAAHILEQQLRCHGFASRKGLTYLRRNAALTKAVDALVAKQLAQGSLEEVKVANGAVFIMKAGALDGPLPRLSQRMQILSPFDNSVIQRDRLKALFQFDYQIECYVPEVKRKYGYFCLPLLYRGEFIGRMDCKAHRKTRHLEIRALYFDAHPFDQDSVVAAFVQAVMPFRQFQGCESVSLTKVDPKPLSSALQRALMHLG